MGRWPAMSEVERKARAYDTLVTYLRAHNVLYEAASKHADDTGDHTVFRAITLPPMLNDDDTSVLREYELAHYNSGMADARIVSSPTEAEASKT